MIPTWSSSQNSSRNAVEQSFLHIRNNYYKSGLIRVFREILVQHFFSNVNKI